MITVGDKTYNEDDLNEYQISQVKRIIEIRNTLNNLNMQQQELSLIHDAHTSSLEASLSHSDEEPDNDNSDLDVE